MKTLGHGEKYHARLKAIRTAADHCTHIIPRYHPFTSKGVDIDNKYLSWIVNSIRAFLLEDLYMAGE